jgi:branched-chain amino acid transport system permease protein
MTQSWFRRSDTPTDDIDIALGRALQHRDYSALWAGWSRPKRVAVSLGSAGLVFLLALLAVNVASLLLLSALTIGASYCLLAMGTNVIFDWTGLFPFGQAAVFGVGTYTAALLPHKGLAAPVVLLICAGTGCVFQAVMMLGLSRFSHIGFGMLTLVISQVLEQFATNSNALGAVNDGILGIPRSPFFGLSIESSTGFWWYAIGVVSLCFLGYVWLSRTTFILWIRALRDDEERVATLGKNPVLLRTMAGIPAGLLCGISGGLYAQFGGIASPINFDFSLSGAVLFMCLLGGRKYIFGPIIGAFAYTILTEDIFYGNTYSLVLIGALLVAVILLVPDGLLGVPQLVRQRLSHGGDHVLRQRLSGFGTTLLPGGVNKKGDG